MCVATPLLSNYLEWQLDRAETALHSAGVLLLIGTAVAAAPRGLALNHKEVVG